uniref:Uncharacterized protein n=1 Tax=Apteryx owenii TaxID=8824 RepID=A0A8B9NT64_APTOW
MLCCPWCAWSGCRGEQLPGGTRVLLHLGHRALQNCPKPAVTLDAALRPSLGIAAGLALAGLQPMLAGMC